jgi:RimJ/RimL family protein N-acetyltransferase
VTGTNDVQIRTRRLLLRRFAPSDIPAILELTADPDVYAAAANLGATEAEAAGYVHEQEALEAWQVDGVFDLAIERLEDGAIVGLLTLVRRAGSGRSGFGEVGYALHPSARGAGLATEATTALVAHVFEVLKLPQVIIETAISNRGARGVAERLGAQVVAHYDDDGTPSTRYHLDVSELRQAAG